MSAPNAMASAVEAALPSTRSYGSASRIAPMKDLRDAPTNMGRLPRLVLIESRCRNASRL